MTSELINTLITLKSDPTVVVNLYKQLFVANFFALVRSGTENSLDIMEFLTYDTSDDIRGLPLFTKESHIIDDIKQNSSVVQVKGSLLWNKLHDILEKGRLVIEIDPGQDHGIRLTKDMVLAMIAKYRTA